MKERDINKFRKPKKMLYKQFFEFSLQIRIYLDNEVVKISHNIVAIIIIFSIFQETSFLLDNYYDSNTQQLENVMKCLNILMTFTRPYKILSQSFFEFSYIIPLILQTIYYLLIVKLFIESKLSKRTQKKFDSIILKQNRILIIFMKTLSYFQALQYHIFFIIQIELIVESIAYNSGSQNLAVYNVIFAIFSLIILLFSTVAQMLCNLEQNFKLQPTFGILQESFTFYWRQISFLVIIFLNQLHLSQNLKFYILFSIILLKILFSAQTQLLYFVKTYSKSKYQILSQAGQLVTIVILLILKTTSNYYLDSLLLLISIPISIQIVHDMYKIYHENTICQRKNSKNAYEKQYKITEICSKYGVVSNSFVKNKLQMTFIYNFIHIHQYDCQNLSCKCRNQSLTFEKLIQLFIRDEIKEFGYLVNITKDPTAKQTLFLRYLFFISYIGLNTKAFQQSNIKVQLDSEMNSKTNLQSYQRTDPKLESVNSQEQKSHSLSRQKFEVESDEFISIKIHKFNLIQSIKLNFLQERIKQKMSIGLGQTDQQKDSLEHAVNLFLISEEANRRLQSKIVLCLNRKRLYFANLLQNNLNIFSSSKSLLVKLKKTENELLTLYDNFPSKKMQALNTFFQSEIMNNYFYAFKLSCVASISDEKLLKMQSQISFDLFSSKVDYIIFGFDQKTHHLEILSTSNKINNFFTYTLDQFKQVKFIEQLLPLGFELVHQKLVQSFLETGQSKFFRDINLSFCRTINKCIKPMQFFFDLNLSNFNNMKFVSFLQDTQISSAFIICGTNNKIQSMTRNISQKLGFSQKLGTQLVDKLIQQQIIKVFPKFNTIYDSYQTKGSILVKEQDTEVLQEKQNTIDQSENQIIMHVPDIHNLENQTKGNWLQNENNTIQFIVDAVFHFRNLLQDGCQYVIIEIRDAKKMMATEVSTPFQSVLPLSTNNNLDLLTSLTDLEKNFEIAEDQESYCLSPPRALEFQVSANKADYFGSKLKFNIDNSQSQNNIQNISISIPLVSPKDSSQRLIDEKMDSVLLQKEKDDEKKESHKIQKYFSANENNDADHSSRFLSSIIPVQQDNNDKKPSEGDENHNENNESNDQQISRRIKIINKNTDGSSEAGIKKSRLAKKYELIYKIGTSTNFSQYFEKMKYLIILMFVNFIVFGIIEILFSQNDFPQFLKELDLLQIKANIIGPIDNYVVGQNAVTNYGTLYQEEVLTWDETVSQSQYANNEIGYTYIELKTSFENQLQNPYLDPFFEDRYINVQMAKYPNTVSYTIRVREAIQLELWAALKFIEVNFLNDDEVDYTQGFFTFLLRNYSALRDLFQSLNEEMLNYSINRASSVSSIWYQLLIPILISGAILLLGAIISYRLYLLQYDQIIELFKFVENQKIQKDMERLRAHSTLLGEDSDVLFKFQFDILAKEEKLFNEDQKKENIQQIQTLIKEKQKQTFFGLQQKMLWLPSLFLFVIIFGICFVFCFISNSFAQLYYQKYPETTKFFNLLSDLSMASSGVFSMREISYSIKGEKQIYFFFPNKDASYFIKIFFNHMEVIDKFLQQITQFDTSGYITSDSFVSDFNDLMAQDVCSFLPDYKIVGAQKHCDIAMDGVMRRGMVQTLNGVRNSLEAEYQTSVQFTNEIISKRSDLELGLMAYDVLNDLRDQFQQQLVKSTNQLISQLMAINVSFLVILFLSIISLITIVEQYFKWEFQIVKQFIVLLPQETLFLDNQLDRNLRQLVVKENLI